MPDQYSPAESLQRMHAAILTLAGLSPDGVAARNDVGFSGATIGYGMLLARISPEDWPPFLQRKAWEVCRTHHKRQVLGESEFARLWIPPDVRRGTRGDNPIRIANGAAPRTNPASAPRTMGIGQDWRGRESFALTFGYQAGIKDQIKGLGGYWNKAESTSWDHSVWNLPIKLATVESVVRLARDCGFSILDDAAERIQDLLDTANETIAESRAESADVTVTGLSRPLYPFQAAGVAYMLRNRDVLVADEMGLGKTVEAIATVVHESAYPALVVCPASVKLNWAKEVLSWVPGASVSVLNGASQKAAQVTVNGETVSVPVNNYDSQWTIVNYDMLDKHYQTLLSREYRSIIVDESHYIKSHKALRTQKVVELCTGGHWDKAKNQFVQTCNKKDIRLLLTGTPILNRPVELVPQLQALGKLQAMGGFWTFCKRYAAAYQDAYGWHMDGAANLDELNTLLRANCYLRREKSQVLTDLPEKSRLVVDMPLENESEYRRAERAWALAQSKLQNGAGVNAFIDYVRTLDFLTPAQQNQVIHAHGSHVAHLVVYTALKQLAVKGKMAAIQEWVSDFLASGRKLVLFAWHRETVDLLAATFNAPSIKGGDSAQYRQNVVERFQNDPDCRVVVCNIIAAGEGITLTAASDVAFVEMGWNPGKHQQAEDRIHRIGQRNACTAWYLLAPSTIDTDLYSLIWDEKGKIVDDATGGTDDASASLLGTITARITKRQ